VWARYDTLKRRRFLNLRSFKDFPRIEMTLICSSRTWEWDMARQKTQFPRVPLREIEKLVKQNGTEVPGRGRRRAAESVKKKAGKTVQSRGA